jgi:SAM-dependent methyltransferase
MSEDRGGAPLPKTPEPGATVPDLNALDRDGSSESVKPPPVSSSEARANARRRARTLRIPDDEVSRPTSSGAAGQGRSEPPPPVQSASPPRVAAVAPSPDSAVLTPMRIISINPAVSESPAPPVAIPAPSPAARVQGEDSWTPFQPTVADGADGADVGTGAGAEESGVRTPRTNGEPEARAPLPSEDLIPIETEVHVPVDEAPVEAAPPSGEPIDPLQDDTEPPTPVVARPESVAARAPGPPVPPLRSLSPTEPEGEEVKFEDDALTSASPPAELMGDGERRSDPGAEIGVEDVVAVEPAATAVSAKAVANLPPMRPRLDSKPPMPPPAKKVTQPQLARPPLVIVPPHGTLAPASGDGPGTRRKGRLWWEDLFNDDYLRACEKVTDEQIAREVDFVEDSLGIEKGGTVLDLACGTGRHAVELSRRGYEVVGFDLSLAMLARAGDEAQDRDAKLNFIQGDMREMSFEEQFDGVFCWNTSFGYFEEEKNAQVIDRIHRALKSEGLLLLDVVNRDFLIRQSPSLAWFEGDGCVCMDEMNIDFITSRMKIKRTLMLDDGRSREIEYSLRVYSLHELGRILHEHGFKVCEVSGRIATPSVFFGNESPRTIILAEKR